MKIDDLLPVNFMRLSDLSSSQKTKIYRFLSQTIMSDPYTDIHRDKSVSKEVVPLHSHPFYEILFIKSGNLNYLLDGQRYVIQSGDILLIPPGVGHRPLFLEQLKEPYERIIIWINDSYLARISKEDPEIMFAFSQCRNRSSYLLRSTPATWKPLLTAAEHLLHEKQQNRFASSASLKYSVLTLMIHISRTYYYQDIPAPAAEDSPFDTIISYIDNHLSEKITLEKASVDLLISKSTITHQFPAKMGTTFYNCIIQRRLILVKNNILSGIPIHKAWENCGFSDYSTFYRAFYKEYGMSPKNFQKAAATQNNS